MFALALVAVLVSRWVVSIARLSMKGMVVSKERTKRFNQRHTVLYSKGLLTPFFLVNL